MGKARADSEGDGPCPMGWVEERAGDPEYNTRGWSGLTNSKGELTT